MSDEDDFSESDFSASEEEWVPNKNAKESESDDDDDDVDPEAEALEIAKNSTVRTKSTKNKKQSAVTTLNISKQSKKLKRKSGSNPNSLRSKMFKKYQPPPKVISAPKLTPGRSTPSVARSSTKKTKKPNVSDESSSSGDEALVNPKDLDLKSSFFDIGSQVKPLVPCEPPNFDCNGGMIISESEEEDDDNLEEIDNCDDDDQDDDEDDNDDNDEDCAESPFKNFYDYHQKVEEVKNTLKKFENQNLENCATGVDITSLLAMGEAGPSQKPDEKIKKNRKKNHNKIDNDSNSDWEQVEENEEHNGISKDNNDVLQIIVEHPKTERYQKKKSTDEEASLMRKLNRVIKENQLVKHKASLLCQIAHGNYLNRILNTSKLMKQALKLLPNGDKSYPNGKTDVSYFESITKWFSAKFKIKNYEMYTGERNRNYLNSLENQIDNGEALSKKDFVLIFIILLRAMGIQCRMVMNLVTINLRPAQADLCTIKQKKQIKPVSNKKKAAPRKKNVSSSSFRVIEEKVIRTPEKKEPRVLRSSDVFDEVLHKVSKYPLPSTIVSSDLIVAKEEICSVSPKKNDDKTKKNNKIKTDDKTKQDDKIKTDDKSKKDGNKNKFRISPLFMLKQENTKHNTRSQSLKRKLTVPQMDGADDSVVTKKKRVKTDAQKQLKKLIDSDDDFVNPPPKNFKTATTSNKLLEKVKKIDRRVLSTDDENILLPINKKKNAMDIWIEVYCETDNRWITIDLFHTKVNCVDSLKKQATSPISYVFAWNNDLSLKDVSPRYCSEWNTITRKNRVEKEWLDEAIKRYLGKKTKRDIIEDKELDKIHLDKPLPTTIHEFKNHPLYALKRHLLKFEALYPSTAPTLGFVRGEAIYPRDCVHLCHSRDIWLKEARVVRPGEKPYKIVKARPKWDRLTNTCIKDLPLEIFGYWQTTDYEPPTAENGVVPRNAYGNVELFKMCMLPKKTVHLRLTGLQKVCKKLNVDCAPAVIGFDFNQGNCHPMYDGFIICEEFQDEVVAAWYAEQEEAEKRETEKYEQRVYGNWKKLIKGLYIRQKLKSKYNFEGVPEESLASLQKKLQN